LQISFKKGIGMSTIPDAISVVIPTYNRAHLIKASLQSVLDQTLQPLEIIVVDDFSTDNTEEVVQSLNSPLIKYVKNQRKKGANGARNTGILMAQGEFIAFHDSDDIWLPDKLKLQKQVFDADPSIDLCFCSLLRKKNKKSKNKKFPVRHILEPKKVVYHSSVASTQTIMVRNSLCINNLFNEDLMRFQDWDFILNFSKNNKIFHLDRGLVIQTLQQDSISSKNNYLSSLHKLFAIHDEIKLDHRFVKLMILNGLVGSGVEGRLLKIIICFIKVKGLIVDRLKND
jgi:glycosyltransferase involved in cell wall biosynthesis